MPQWEYDKIDLNDAPRRTEDVDLLNEAGKTGWGLVHITSNNVAYLKRQASEPERTRAGPHSPGKRSPTTAAAT